jgi:hypothetical protein
MLTNTNGGTDAGKKGHLHFVGRKINRAATKEISVKFPQETKHATTLCYFYTSLQNISDGL